MPTADDQRAAALVGVMRAHGGYGLSMLRRSLGGYRVRFWIPDTPRAREECRRLNGNGWQVEVLPHYEGDGSWGQDGLQVVATSPATAALPGTRHPGLQPGERGLPAGRRGLGGG